MTERKPKGTSFTSWIDQQLAEAEKRGAFDDLPGAGKPIPHREETDYVQVWLRDYLRREGVPAEDLLPAPLKLRKEIGRLEETARDLRSEQDVRAAVGELNQRIMDWRRRPLGPPLFVPLADEEKIVTAWREAHPEKRPPSPARAGDRPGDRAGDRPGDRAGDRPGDRAGDRPGDRAPARRGWRRAFRAWLSRGGTSAS